MSQVLREFAPLCRTTRDLTPAAIGDWLAAHPERSPPTHRSLLSTLRAACTYGAFRSYLANPFAYRPLARWLPADELEERDAEPFRRHRTASEVRAVLARAVLARADAETGEWKERRLRALIYTYAYTGASKCEVLGLRVSDIDLASGVVAIRSHARRRLKTGSRSARLPIAPPLCVVLERWVAESDCEWLFPCVERSGPWLHGRMGYRPLDQIKALAARAGVDGLTILSLRHTVATLSEGWGIGETLLQRILRHSRVSTQLHYRHEDLDQLRRAVGRITYEDVP